MNQSKLPHCDDRPECVELFADEIHAWIFPDSVRFEFRVSRYDPDNVGDSGRRIPVARVVVPAAVFAGFQKRLATAMKEPGKIEHPNVISSISTIG